MKARLALFALATVVLAGALTKLFVVVIGLLRQAGFEVREETLSVDDFMAADEIFTSGNYSKVVGVNRLDDRELQEGPVTRKALEIYMNWAFGRSASDS